MGYGGHVSEALSRMRINRANRRRKKELHDRIEEAHSRITDSRSIHPDHFKKPSQEELDALKTGLSIDKRRYNRLISISVIIAIVITVGLVFLIT